VSLPTTEKSPYWSRLVRSLSPYIPGEQPRDKNIIKLNTNENPYPPSPKVIEAIQKAAGEKLRLYPDPTCAEFREAAAARCGVKPEQVFAGNGSDEILAFAFAAFFESGTMPLLFPDISYSFYPVYAALWDKPFKTIPLTKDFSIDPRDYLQNSGGVIFPNPNAPTGRALGQTAIKEIAVEQEKNKKVLIVDEAYIAFADKSGIGSMIPFINDHPNLLVVQTLSKAASLAGLRTGFAVGNEELIKGLCRVRDSFNSYTLDRLALAGAAAAVSDTPYYNEINTRVCRTRDRVSSALEALGFFVIPSQANFIFASPPASSGKSGGQIFSALREKGILVRHFNKPRIDNFLRISIGTDEDMDALLEASNEILTQKN
jgi:histidinol-phosphate aminotransferase